MVLESFTYGGRHYRRDSQRADVTVEGALSHSVRYHSTHDDDILSLFDGKDNKHLQGLHGSESL